MRARTCPDLVLLRRAGQTSVKAAKLMSELTVDHLVTLCACGHDIEEHDRISARFCAATTSGGLTRRCVCPVTDPEPAPPATQRHSYQLDSYRH